LLEDFLRRWSKLSLALQFLVAGGVGLLAVMLVVGLWVTSQIRQGVTRNSAATTALYVDSVIAPLLPDMRKSREAGLRIGMPQVPDDVQPFGRSLRADAAHEEREEGNSRRENPVHDWSAYACSRAAASTGARC